MIGLDEQALTCDMAETYGIYDIWALPVKTAATLAAGLRPFSRIRAEMYGLGVPLDAFMQASILDHLRLLWWSKTKDGQKNLNRPQSITEILMPKEEDEPDVQTFVSGEDFDREWKKLTGGDDHG